MSLFDKYILTVEAVFASADYSSWLEIRGDRNCPGRRGFDSELGFNSFYAPIWKDFARPSTRLRRPESTCAVLMDLLVLVQYLVDCSFGGIKCSRPLLVSYDSVGFQQNRLSKPTKSGPSTLVRPDCQSLITSTGEPAQSQNFFSESSIASAMLHDV